MAKLNTQSEQTKTTTDLISGHNSRMQLLAYVERYERLQEEKESLADDQKEVMEEAKGLGFDTKIIRKVIQRRKMDTAARMETDALLELYEDTIAQAMKQQVRDSEAEAGQPKTRNAKIDAAKKVMPPAQMDVEEAIAQNIATETLMHDMAVKEQPWPDDQQAAESPPVPHSELPDPPAFLRRAK